MINVLIVDDDAMVAELNKCYLNQISGFSCYATVPTLQQARNLLMQPDCEIDLVLLDIYMQQDNGLDLLPTIREFSEHTDVIIISSASDVYTIKKSAALWRGGLPDQTVPVCAFRAGADSLPGRSQSAQAP
ncbi:hypothetical protein OS42_35370 [Dickeya oryzae]